MKNKLFLIIPSTILFLSFGLCYFFLSYYNRFSADDFYTLQIIDEKNFFNSLVFFYNKSEGAYGGFIYAYALGYITSSFTTPFILNIISITLVFISFYFLFSNVLKKVLFVNNTNAILLLSIIAISTMYYNDLAVGEIWYWATGSFYLVFPTLFLLSLTLFLTTKNKYLIISCFIFFILFGGVKLNYTCIALAFLFLFSIMYFKVYGTINKKIMVVFSIIFVALVIYLIAPGNYNRHEKFANKISFTFIDIILNTFKMSLNYIKDYLLVKLPFHILFMFPVLYVGIILKQPIRNFIKTKRSALNLIFASTIILFILILCQCFVLYIAKGGQTKRSLPMINTFVTIYLINIFLLIGTFYLNKKIISVLYIFGILSCSFLLYRRFNINKPIVIEFAEATDIRIKKIENTIKNYNTNPIDTLYLPKLPSSGWLHSCELTTYLDGDGMANDFLMGYYKTKFIIDLENIKIAKEE